MRHVSVDDAGLSITTFGLRESFFAGKSFVPQWKNRWVAGKKEDRVYSAKFSSRDRARRLVADAKKI